MEHSFWRDKWKEPEQGFNQLRPHPSLPKQFPKLGKGARVLVPLCGKSIDMIWLAEQGYSVTGIELVEDAVEDFFKEHQLSFNKSTRGELVFYQAQDKDITIIAGDFFAFEPSASDAGPFDALYDRAALVALPEPMRAEYTNHCLELLREDARIHLVVFDYDTGVKEGPPFSIPEAKVRELWGDRINPVSTFDMLAVDSPFKDGGFSHFNELVYQG